MRHFGDRRDEALYWKERPLTFNTSCFGCHVSQLSKNYDLKADSYHTTWAEPGINCETCHGPSAGHVQLFRELPTNQPAPADIKLIVTEQAHHRAAQRHLRPLPRQDVARDHELRPRRPLLRSLRPGRRSSMPTSTPMAATWARTTPTPSGGSAPAPSPASWTASIATPRAAATASRTRPKPTTPACPATRTGWRTPPPTRTTRPAPPATSASPATCP